MAGGYVVRHARIYTPLTVIEDGYIVVVDGRIKEVGYEPYGGTIGDTVDAEGLIVAPGFIDTHMHGYRGYDSNQAEPETYLGLSRELVRHGVTSFIPSTVTAPHDLLVKASRAIREAYSAWSPSTGARILGLHLEGPYISIEKKGAQNPEYIRPPSIGELEEYMEASGGLIRQITVAPEVPGALDLISYAVSKGIIVSIGHTNASYTDTVKAVAAGASKATHLYNGMRGIHHREPGPVIAFLENPSVFLELICDFIHVSKPMVRFTVDYAGYNRVVLITDSINAAGLPDGRYVLGGLEVIVENGVPRLAGSGALAGSTLTMDRAVKNMYSLGYPLNHVLAMASLTPARSVAADHRERIGLIKPGYRADLVFLDIDLNVIRVAVDGEIVYER